MVPPTVLQRDRRKTSKKRAPNVERRHGNEGTRNRVRDALRAEPCAAYPELYHMFLLLPGLKRTVMLRFRTLEAMAPTLRRVNPSNPNRSKIDKARTKLRKKYKQDERAYDREIATLVSKAISDAYSLDAFMEMASTKGIPATTQRHWWKHVPKRNLPQEQSAR
jgi:hypothetical protein